MAARGAAPRLGAAFADELETANALRDGCAVPTGLEARAPVYSFPITIFATLRPISTAEFVPRSHGYTWLMLANHRPESGS